MREEERGLLSSTTTEPRAAAYARYEAALAEREASIKQQTILKGENNHEETVC